MSPRWSSGGVVLRERGGEAALGPVGGGLGERAGRDQRHLRAAAGGGERGEQPGGAGAHDDEVGAESMQVGPYGTGVSRTSGCATSSRSPTTSRHPERPQRIVALEAEMERHGWFGCDARARHRRRPRAAARRASGVARRFIEALPRARRRARSTWTPPRSPETYEAALRAAGGAVALVDALLDGDAAPASRRCGRPATTPSRARAMGFCFFDNVAVAARRAHGGARRRAGADRRLGRPPRQRHQAIFHADPDVLFVSIHEWPLYPGTGPASDVGPGTARATRSTCRCRRQRDATYRSLVDHVVLPLISTWEPGLVLVSAGFDAHALDPLATAG